MNWLKQKKVLVLNKSWLVIGIQPVDKVLADMFTSGPSPKQALKIEYEIDSDGNPNYDKPTEVLPLTWDQWLTISPRDFDEKVIHTPNILVRVPTVVIATGYNQMPKKRFHLSKKGLYERDGGKCGYTGKKLSLSQATIDHIKPKAQG